MDVVAGAAEHRPFGPYDIRAPLGHGGGGEVYRAWDPRLQREVALKILRGRHEPGADRVRRFVAEARAASALNHPNILTVFDAAVDGDTPYIVSELIDGRSLRDEISRRPLPLKRLLDLAAQIADGLAAAHDANIVHRDLKPENILVTRSGRIKIVDFGLAHPAGFRPRGLPPGPSTDETLTESGLLTGTVPYMSPEQARGLETDFHSDQFSFGLMLYEMATGRNPFRRDTPAATLDAIINDELPPLAAYTARLPLLLRWIVERCLAKDVGERYASTADLHRDLAMLRDRTAEAVSQDIARTGVRSASRWRVAFVMAAALAVLATAGVLVIGPPVDRPPFDSSALRFTPFATAPGYEGFPAMSPDGQTVAYAADVDGVLQIFTRRLTSAAAAQLTFGAYDGKHPFWSPDGKRIYYGSLMRDRDGIWSIAAAGGLPQAWLEDATRAAISPDGRSVAFLRDEHRADIVGTAALWIATPPDGELHLDSIEQAKQRYAPLEDLRFVEGTLAFSPDGRTLGLSAIPLSINLPPEARGWHFWMLPLPDGRPVRRMQAWPEAAPRVSNFAWLGDGRHIVLSIVSPFTPGSDLWVADLKRDRAWALTRSPDSEYYPSVSPSGTIVFTKDEGDYDLVEVSPRGELMPLLATSRNEAEASWSPVDPNVFVHVTDRNGQDELWMQSRDSQLLRPLVTQEDFGVDQTILLSAPAFAPDGQRVAYQRNGSRPVWPLRVWYSHVAGGPPVELVSATREGYHGAPSWSPNGEWIAFAEWRDQRWTLVTVRVGSNEPPVELRTDGAPNATARWSPRGDWITWETADEFLLVSPDGDRQLSIPTERWLVHEWSRDGSAILAIRQTEDLRLSLERLDVPEGGTRVILDLGPSPPVNHPIRGLTVSPDGTVATALFRLRGDLWLLDGLRLEPSWASRFWPFRVPHENPITSPRHTP